MHFYCEKLLAARNQRRAEDIKSSGGLKISQGVQL